jgi:hypothetical protein
MRRILLQGNEAIGKLQLEPTEMQHDLILRGISNREA